MEKIGKRIPIDDARVKTTGKATYVDDLRLPGMLHAVLLLSEEVHAELISVDADKALAMEGVRAVFSFFNTPNTLYNGAAPFDTEDFPAQERLFSKRIRHQGDRIAMVVADSKKQALAAAKQVRCQLETLPSVLNMEESLQEDAPQVDPDGNLQARCEMMSGDLVEVENLADGVFKTRMLVPSYHQAAMEPHGVVADCDELGGVIVYSPTQNIFSARMICAKVLGISEAQVRVVQSTMGGSFGSKLEIILEPLCAYASYQLKRPVKLVLNRKQTMKASRRSYGILADIRSFVHDGKWIGLDIDILVDAGGYCSSGQDFIWAMSAKPFRLYNIPHVRYRAASVLTNKTTASAMRGYGSTQLITALEHHVDALAKHLSTDPGDWRRRYAFGPDGKDLRDGKTFGSIGLWDCIDEGKREFDWPLGVRTEDEQYWYGASLALGIHGNGMYPVHTDLTTMGLKMNMDGSLVLNTGTVDMGTGANTSFRMIVAEVMGVPLEKVGMQRGDTTACPYDLGCYASRSIYVAGNAALKVASSMRKRIEQETGRTLEDVNLGEFALQAFRRDARDIYCQETYVSNADPMSYAAHFARVRVDKHTLEVQVLDYLAAHDIGRAINPMSLEGQIEGAVQMGIGMALKEGLRFDPDGKLLNSSFKNYPLIKAVEMPKISVKLIESEETTGPFGAKSIGEIAAVPVVAAVTNAVSVALDMTINELPINEITARRDR